MIIGVPKETFQGERRVAVVPVSVPAMVKKGFEVRVESGAGEGAGVTDAMFADKGAKVVGRADLFASAQAVLQIRAAGANPSGAANDLAALKKDQTVIAFCEPLSEPQSCRPYADRGVTLLSMELMPRITRAQSMDALSSMATIAGYKAVLEAANTLPKMFPLMMTAAGTLAPAQVFVIGVGVAGLQAISTAKRLGAVVSAYDVRPAVKDQVVSVGGKFVELELDTAGAEGAGGYAKEQGEEFIRKQREMMARVVAASDVVITTAAIPGKKSPVLVTADMVKGMQPGSVIVDLAAERGGNCELTQGGKTVVAHGVTILGPLNLPSAVPYHASQMYSKNITTFLFHLLKDGALNIDATDEITAGTLVTRGGQVVHPKIRELLGKG